MGDVEPSVNRDKGLNGEAGEGLSMLATTIMGVSVSRGVFICKESSRSSWGTVSNIMIGDKVKLENLASTDVTGDVPSGTVSGIS